MNSKLLVIFLVFVAFAINKDLNAQIYVNSNTGNDATGDGSSGNPYKTFTKGYSMVVSGGTLDLTGTFTWTDANETGDNGTDGFTINKNITIQGPSGGLAVVQSASSLVRTQRIFYIPAGYTVILKNLELRHGYTPASVSMDGGAIACFSNITILNCYIHSNIARQGCGIDAGEITIHIENTTIANNVSTEAQSGLAGAGILLNGGVLTLTNSTIYNNSGLDYGGGIYMRHNTGRAIITNSTIVNNSAVIIGGGIGLEGTVVLTIKNSMVANNFVGASGDDIDHFQGTITDNGYNIVEIHNSSSITGTGTITGNQTNLFGTGVGSTPSLALNNSTNGVPTIKTISGSVAINAGNSSANGSVNIPTTDQRGAERNGIFDIGAYEYWDDDGALPVELTSFIAKISENKVTLNWQTATEIDNYGFEVQRTSTTSAPGQTSIVNNKKWEKIGFVAGHGNSNSPKEYSFIDNDVTSGRYLYRLKQIDIDGQFEFSKTVEVNFNFPVDFSVKQNFPNPFNPTTKIEFSIPSDNNVEIKIFNVLGMEVATLLNENKQAGTHSIEFNASNLSSGIYYYKVVSGNYSEIKKMILLR
jgi:hypothetical protein